MENIKLGGDYKSEWKTSTRVENIKLGGECQAGWRISSGVEKSSWAENSKLGGDY